MIVIDQQRPSNSPFVASVTQGYMPDGGCVLRPAEVHWHMVITTHDGLTETVMVGPFSQANPLTYGPDAEALWIRFELGTWLRPFPLKQHIDTETILPDASGRTFWLQSATWEFPTYDNVEVFVERLAQQEIVVQNPVIQAALQNKMQHLPERTLRHHFLKTTGQSQRHIEQVQRASTAARLLSQGISITETINQTGYYDQPHLTRALKKYAGHTPAEIAASAGT